MAESVSVGEALNGLTCRPLDPGTVAIAGIAVIKALDSDGTPVWVLREFSEMSSFEVVGALTTLLDRERKGILRQFEPDDEDEEQS